MAGIEEAFEKFVKKISDIEGKDTEDDSNIGFGKNVYSPQGGLFFSPVQKNQIPFGDILKSDQRLNPPIPTPTQRNLSSEERMRLEDNEYFMSQGKPQYVSPVVQGQGFNKRDLKDFTKQYLQSQTSLGGGIGYQGPEYGLVAIKPFVGPDRSALLQGYYNTDNEGSRIQAGLSPKEQRIDYTGNTGTTFSAGRNTYQGNPYYTFNVNKPFADGGVASMFRERPGYAEGETVEYDDGTDLYNQALEANIRQETEKGALAQQKFSDYLKEKTGYENIDAYYQDPGYQSYNPRAADKDITKAIYDNINLQGYKPFGYEDKPFEFGFDQDPNAFYQLESGYDLEGNYTPKRIRPYTSEEKQSLIKNNVENELYRQSLFDPYRFGFSNERQPTIESSKFFLDQLRNLQGRDSDFADVIKKGNYIDLLESNLRSMYDDGEYQKLQETLDPGYSKYASDSSKINKAFDTSDVLANYDSVTGKIDSSIYTYLSDAERNIIQQSQGLPTYLTGYAQQLIQDARNRKQESENQRTAAAEYNKQFSNLPTTQYSLSDELGFERPQIDPFSGQQVSMQDQIAFTQPQAEIFPQQNIFQPPSPVDQFIGERRFQSEADAAARSGIPFTKTKDDYFSDLGLTAYGKTAFDAFNQIGLTPAKQTLVNQALSSAPGIGRALLGEIGGGFKSIPGGVGLGEYVGQGLRSLGQAATLNNVNLGVNPAVGGGTLGSRVLGSLIGAPAIYATALFNPTTMGNAELTPAMRSQQEASARVMPTRMAYGGRVSMSDGGLTTTIAPAKGPDSQGVESLFTRRYN